MQMIWPIVPKLPQKINSKTYKLVGELSKNGQIDIR